MADRPHRVFPPPSWSRAPLGFKVILLYKSVKAPLMLALALWLTLAPRQASVLAERIVEEISERGALLHRLSEAVHAYLSPRVVSKVAVVAWLDGFATLIEALLLLLGKAWGEWIVVAGVGSLVPLELISLERSPSIGKLLVLTVNTAVALYLVWHRLHARREPRSRAL